jgi:hypothetical protein
MTASAAAPVDVSPTPIPARAHSRWLWAAVLTVATAGALHIAAAADHLEAGQLAVGFFLLTAFAQLGFAAWLVVSAWAGAAPSRQVVALALIGTVGLVVLYVVAHTTNLLDAFAVPHDAGTGHHAVGTTTPSQVDPATGVDLSAGHAVQSGGEVALAAETAAVRHAPGLLGTATVTAELLAVAALTALLPSSWRRRTTDALLALGGLAWALWFAGVLG